VEKPSQGKKDTDKTVEIVEYEGGRVGNILDGGLLPVERIDKKKGSALTLPFPASDLKYVVTKFDGGAMKSNNLRLGVSTSGWDNIGQVLERLGAGFQYTTIYQNDIQDMGRLSQFDVIFLNCGGGVLATPQAIDALRKFTEMGGTI